MVWLTIPIIGHQLSGAFQLLECETSEYLKTRTTELVCFPLQETVESLLTGNLYDTFTIAPK